MPALLALFIPALWGALISLLGSLVGRVLLALFISYVTYQGCDIAVGAIFTLVKNSFAGVGAETVQFLGFMWVDKAISTVFSAFTASMAIKTAAGSITKMVIKK